MPNGHDTLKENRSRAATPSKEVARNQRGGVMEKGRREEGKREDVMARERESSAAAVTVGDVADVLT
ncbi:hypothetical protein Ahy_A02g005748 isoform A [Arachis hypogaea]|uniref:Uncharacterized protein n=1 Tax=Arachis hypogaea TaxID=3818 RepID=A0A445E7X1_ARAHY|nr:hypothetical protein Ahy_A02g005748 isoform A [Arachis hypogaea]